MGIITHCLRVESGGNMSAMIVLFMNINTHFLIIENDRNMSAVIMIMVQLMEWDYAPT